MKAYFTFGEKIQGYDYLVINERDARASAGIMFLLGLLSLFSVYIFRTILWAELFSITFIVEFFVRTAINPKYAPYMILGSLFVSKQKPEWVEAKPKKFAWILGMILGIIMTYYIVFDVISLVRLSICLLCLSLLYIESAFGICLGCILYHKLNIKLKNCPGGVCEVKKYPLFPKIKVLFLVGFILSFVLTYQYLIAYKYHENKIVTIIDDN